jgi:glyoxylase-like metal-dependent hydrolase (beta-lactamase superfamily II)
MDLAVTTVVVSPFQQNCRVIVEKESGDAVIVDPGDEAPRILAAVRKSGGTPKYILATHAHLDHVGAVQPVKDALHVPFALHRGDFDLLRALPEQGRMFGMRGLKVPSVEIDLAETKELPFGKGVIRVVHTPGHTPGGVTFLFGDKGDKGLFGDSLFHLSVGRTDLGGDPEVYAKTIRDVILRMPDATEVHSGHGPSSTMGVERRENPFLNGSIDVSRLEGGYG